SLWQNFVLDYNADRRSEAAEAISNGLTRGELGSALAVKVRKAFQDPGLAVEWVTAAAVAVALLAFLWRVGARRLLSAARLRKRQVSGVPKGPPFALACYEQLLLL